jgi:hypothetical protein
LVPLAKNTQHLHDQRIGHGDLHGGNLKVDVSDKSFPPLVFGATH